MIREHLMAIRDTVQDSDSPFIELTICPSYHNAYKEYSLTQYGLNKNTYRKQGVYSNNRYTQSKDLSHIFNSVTHDIDELLYRMVIVTKSTKQSRITIEFNGTNTSEHIEITTKYWHSFGRCYSIHPKDHVIKLGPQNFDIVSRMDVYIYFGYPGQFMHPNSKTKVIKSKSNTSTEHYIRIKSMTISIKSIYYF